VDTGLVLSVIPAKVDVSAKKYLEGLLMGLQLHAKTKTLEDLTS
jgi:hypothetical protein